MKAAVYYEIGGPEVFRYEDVPEPAVRPGGLLIDVAAVGVQGGDLLHRQGGVLATTPHIVGYQASGVVREVGDGVEDFHVGQPVVATMGYGSHAEVVSVLDPQHAGRSPTASRSKRPPACRSSTAPPTTACSSSATCSAGETVLVQAGAGGVGLAAIQLAKAAGATVLATASSDDRLGRLHEHGLDHGINYATDRRRPPRCCGSPTGAASTSWSIRSAAARWRRASPPSPTAGGSAGSGSAGREEAPPEVWPIMQKNGSLTGVFLGAEMARNPQRTHPMIDALLRPGGLGRAAGRHRPHLPAGRGRRGPPLHREPPGLRPRRC